MVADCFWLPKTSSIDIGELVAFLLCSDAAMDPMFVVGSVSQSEIITSSRRLCGW